MTCPPSRSGRLNAKGKLAINEETERPRSPGLATRGFGPDAYYR
jgi:hypothetical protein